MSNGLRFKGKQYTDPQVKAATQSLGQVLIEDFGCPMYEQHLWDGDPETLLVYLCERCQEKYFEWMVDDRDWWRLPRRLRKLRLCTDCFAKAVGFSSGRTASQRFGAPMKKVIESGEPDDLEEVSRGRGQTST